MTDQIPLNYVVAKAQVGQLVEGINGYYGLNPVLKTVAVVSVGSPTVTLAASKD